jgi:hypothetical protein
MAGDKKSKEKRRRRRRKKGSREKRPACNVNLYPQMAPQISNRFLECNSINYYHIEKFFGTKF